MLRHHLSMTNRYARRHAAFLLDRVGIPDAAKRLDSYPHQLSGGMRQRVMIAVAISCEPRLLIADEPTTALDVTVQAQIVDLVRDLQKEFGLAVIWITHDLGVVAGLADRVAVMYAGRLVESAPVADLYGTPLHPYSIGLLGAVPRLGAPSETAHQHSGHAARSPDISDACAFAPRCPHAFEPCWAEVPPTRRPRGRPDGGVLPRRRRTESAATPMTIVDSTDDRRCSRSRSSLCTSVAADATRRRSRQSTV